MFDKKHKTAKFSDDSESQNGYMNKLNILIEFSEKLVEKLEQCGPLKVHSINGVKSEDTKITGFNKEKAKLILQDEIYLFIQRNLYSALR